MNDSFFGKVERKTGVRINDVMALADSLQYANFSDPAVVRGVIRQTASLAGKRVTKQMEDELVRMISANGKKLDFDTLARMMKD